MENNVFLRAFWESPKSALIFLKQDWDAEYLRLPLFLDPDSINFELDRAPSFDVARLSGYFIEDGKIRFVVDPAHHPTLDPNEKIFVAGEFNGWQDAVDQEQYLLKPFELAGHPVFVVDVPVSVLGDAFSSCFRFVTSKHRWLSVPEFAPNLVPNRYQGSDFSLNLKQSGRHVFRLKINEEINLQRYVKIHWRDAQFDEAITISNAEFYLSMCSDLPMGITGEGECWVFRLFAPRAKRVMLELFKTIKQENRERFELNCNDDGSWEISLPKKYDHYFYYYYLDGINYDGSTYFDSTNPVVDPYAKAMASSEGPGIVIPPEASEPLRDGFHPPLWHDLVIAEVHMRDLVTNSKLPMSRTERQQYPGISKWLRSKTNYLRQLGVNALEFQPLHEFEYKNKDEYHWGYMPVNYFSPASANAKFPKKGSQVEGFKEMVKACHEAGFAFILDVVYNHIGSPNALHAIDKHYYFELDSNFNMTNWSGVGNDIRARSPMAKRLIIDSLLHYVTEYGVDGFRFDLAELIGRNVLAEIETELKKVKKSIILIAEPWSFRGHIAEKLKSTGFTSWNDRYREFFLSYLKGNGSPLEFTYYLKGSPVGLTRFPAQTVNYSESHDDYCWMDMITENPDKDGSVPTFNDIRRTHLMFSMLLLSLGIPMISEGQDFLRSKHGVRNTYQRGDINALDYNRLITFSNTHDYVRKLIAFRLSAEGHLLRQEFPPSDDYFTFNFGENGGRSLGVVYNADFSKGGGQIVFAINPSAQTEYIHMSPFSMNDTLQIADHFRFERSGLQSARIRIVDGKIELPPVSCGVWLKGY